LVAAVDEDRALQAEMRALSSQRDFLEVTTSAGFALYGSGIDNLVCVKLLVCVVKLVIVVQSKTSNAFFSKRMP